MRDGLEIQNTIKEEFEDNNLLDRHDRVINYKIAYELLFAKAALKALEETEK
jgi:hypothetical protein